MFHRRHYFLQETWLTHDELPLLRQIHADFDASGVSAMDTGDSILVGRPYGGVAILWRKQLGQLYIILIVHVPEGTMP